MHQDLQYTRVSNARHRLLNPPLLRISRLLRLDRASPLSMATGGACGPCSYKEPTQSAEVSLHSVTFSNLASVQQIMNHLPTMERLAIPVSVLCSLNHQGFPLHLADVLQLTIIMDKPLPPGPFPPQVITNTENQPCTQLFPTTTSLSSRFQLRDPSVPHYPHFDLSLTFRHNATRVAFEKHLLTRAIREWTNTGKTFESYIVERSRILFRIAMQRVEDRSCRIYFVFCISGVGMGYSVNTVCEEQNPINKGLALVIDRPKWDEWKFENLERRGRNFWDELPNFVATHADNE